MKSCIKNGTYTRGIEEFAAISRYRAKHIDQNMTQKIGVAVQISSGKCGGAVAGVLAVESTPPNGLVLKHHPATTTFLSVIVCRHVYRLPQRRGAHPRSLEGD
jgi:hypothetical protein